MIDYLDTFDSGPNIQILKALEIYYIFSTKIFFKHSMSLWNPKQIVTSESNNLDINYVKETPFHA